MKPKVFVTRQLPDWACRKLEETCSLDIWDENVHPPYEVILERIKDKEGLLCLLTDRISDEVMAAAPNLRVISQCAVGYDNIDVEAATKRGIRVGNTPGALSDATADFAFALLMAAARRIGEAIDHVRAGKWKTWGLLDLLGKEVYGATLGIIGMGRIGQAMARRARGFDMQVLYYDRERKLKVEEEIGVVYTSFDEVLEEADFISLHVSLNPETQGLIGERELKLMKPSAVLINTARGPVIDQDALYSALKEGEIAYAALDVTVPEPLPADDKLLTLPNIIVAPHIASATVTPRTEIIDMAVENLLTGLQGSELPYPVNKI
jgi:glyoxylate reductase